MVHSYVRMFVVMHTQQELCECCLVRVASSHMDLQAEFKRALFLAYATHVALGSGVSRNMVVVVGIIEVTLEQAYATQEKMLPQNMLRQHMQRGSL